MKSNKMRLFLMTLTSGAILMACGGGDGASNNTQEAEGNNGTEEAAGDTTEETESYKIGVQIHDATDSEIVAFQEYYEDYIQEQYNVEFLFSSTIATAEEERTSAENFINQGVEAIISFSDSDRPSIINMTEDAGIYYAVGAGTLADEQYDEFKNNEYYVGSIGPSLDEEEQVGYDMARHYIDQGYTNYLIYGGGYDFVDMHKMRTDGMIRALEEEGVVYTAGENGSLGTFESDTFTINTISGFPDDSGAFFGTVSERVGEEGLEVILTAALGVEFFGTSLAQSDSDIKMGTVASFNEAYYEGFNAGQVDYLAGKFSSSIGPIFTAVHNSVLGDKDVVRTADDSAFRIDQGYWIADSLERFNEMYELSNDTENPAYDKGLLDEIIKHYNPDMTYETFESFVQSYSYDEILDKKN